MSGSAFAVTHHAFSSGAGRTSDGNGSHASTLKSPSYTKSVSWQHYQVLDKILNYTNTEMKEAIAQRKPLVTTAGPRSLIFRAAITGVDTSKEGLQFYEVVPVALVVAGTQMATGHRTMDTRLYFEGELIDAATNKPVIKVVRQGEGKDLNNESTPMAFENIKQVIDDMATDATMFDVNKK